MHDSATTLKEYWTFRNESRKKFTHGLHKYPARMHPEIAKNIISDYAEDNRTVIIDPFAGSGGVLIEALMHGNNSIGFDINPFAVLLSKVKTTIINTAHAKEEYLKILRESNKDYKKGKFYPKEIPTDYNVEFWNKPSVIKKLSILKFHISKCENNKIQDFLKICLSHTSRQASNQRQTEFKPWRLDENSLKIFNPNVFEIFQEVCENNYELMNDFKNSVKGNKAKSIVKYGNAVNISKEYKKINAEFLDNVKSQLLITSPPYGDHNTTVAYGQFSYHPGLWLDLPVQQLRDVDKISLGGKRYQDEKIELGSSKLNLLVKEISKSDVKRAADVYAFFYDFDKCLSEFSKILKQGKSHLCFVVGNRTVKRVPVYMDKILVELSKKYDFKHIATFPRYIPNKLMPCRNAPENVTQQSGQTMSEERIVILKY